MGFQLFSRWRNVDIDSADVTPEGRSFHICAATTRKARLATVESLTADTCSCTNDPHTTTWPTRGKNSDFTSYVAFKQSLTGVILIKFCKVYFM